MKSMTRNAVLAGSALVAALIVAAGVIWSGAYNVAADVPHTQPVYTLLDIARQRSISTRARALQVPADMESTERIRQGSGNYDAMCVACHLAPGMARTELSLGLYPAPPDLTTAAVDPAEAFWVIKHGIKASGMPAWGLNMDDEYIWNMVAFLLELPDLDASGYRELVASSDGHSHGGGETDLHGEGGDHHHGDDEHHHGEDSGDHAPHDHQH